MRELRALGLTDDGKSLVLVDLSRGAEGERFRVAADDRLKAALRSGAPRAAQAETRVESALSPREIQARLRAGATADEVAKAAGIPINRIQRYEAPILAERDRVVSEARRASAPGPHRNAPGRPLGTLVDDRLEQEGVEPESVTWDAKRRNDGTWLVTLSMDARGPIRATWSWDPQARRVRAVDAGATAVLAPMPAPTAGPDSLTALAEAAGVATAEVPVEAAERQAVGDDGRRRGGGLPTRGGAGRANGLVVLAGRNQPAEQAEAADVDASPAASSSSSSSNEYDSDVPGGSPSARTERPQPRAEATDILLPGGPPAPASAPMSAPAPSPAAPATPSAPAASSAPATVRPSRQERLPSEPSAAEAPDEATDVEIPTPGAPSTARPAARAGSGRRRSAVPAWDDIMFGARRG